MSLSPAARRLAETDARARLSARKAALVTLLDRIGNVTDPPLSNGELSIGLELPVTEIGRYRSPSTRLRAALPDRFVQAVLDRLGPVSLVALLTTLVLLFGFQGEQILRQPLVIALLAVPILIQVYFNAGLAYMLNRASGEAHSVACPSALIGASNFFELAVAAAISLFGFESGAALATVVGVLIEVPVMLSVVKIVNGTRGWYERGARVDPSRKTA